MDLRRLLARILTFLATVRRERDLFRGVSAACPLVCCLPIQILKVHRSVRLRTSVGNPRSLGHAAALHLAPLLADALALRPFVLVLSRLDEVRVRGAGRSLSLLREEYLVDELGLLLLLPELLEHPLHAQALRRELMAVLLASTGASSHTLAASNSSFISRFS